MQSSSILPRSTVLALSSEPAAGVSQVCPSHRTGCFPILHNFTQMHTIHTHSLLSLFLLTDSPGLGCETQPFKEYTLIRHSLVSQALSQTLGRIGNINNPIFKPPLPPSTYRIKSGHLNTAFEGVLSTTPCPSRGLSPGYASEALAVLLKSGNGQPQPHRWSRGTCVSNVPQRR